MNSTIAGILCIAGSIALIAITGFVLDKITKKAALNKYKHEFTLMCHAVAKEIYAHTECRGYGLNYQIESYIDFCSKHGDLPDAPGVNEFYKLKDYRHFTYLAALKYASQYKAGDFERMSIEKYCSFKLPDFSHYSFYASYDSRSDLNRVPKNNPYILSLFLWAIGVPVCRLIYSLADLVITLIKLIIKE